MSNRILACDLDGVIFRFNDAYSLLIKQLCQVDIPPETSEYPACWHYERAAGVTPEMERAVWAQINGPMNYTFWRFLSPYAGAKEFLHAAQQAYDAIYFVTARSGPEVTRATRDALMMLGVEDPQIILAQDKAPIVRSLEATDFLDDRPENFTGVLAAELTKPTVWLLDRPWNRAYTHPYVHRITDCMEILA